VRYLGVDVGKVARITLEAPQRKWVEMLADIDETAPIDARTRASLSLQGITGLLFIDLKEDPDSTETGALPEGQHYRVIQSAPSDWGVLLRRLPDLANHAIGLVDHVDQLFSDMRRASRDVDSAASELSAVTNDSAPDLKVTLANLKRLTASLANVSDRVKELVARNEPSITRFTGQGLPELERLLHESREAVRDIRDLSRSLKQNPAELFYESNSHGVELPR
jgi:phospholipid/cholesterol/gamma-HCH transport system substrate-binding protein